MTSSIRDIVNTILGSPQFRVSLENTVRSLAPSTIETNNNVGIATINDRTVGNIPPSPVAESPPGIRQQLNRLFPSISSRENHRVRRSHHSRLTRTTTNRSFNKDVILLKSPNTFATLKGAAKSAAYETGYAISDVKFECEWSAEQIVNHIKSLFEQLQGINFDIVVPIGGRLNKPNLQNGNELNGSTFKRIFNQKLVYIRPHQSLLHEDNSNSFEEYECANIAPTTVHSDLVFDDNNVKDRTFIENNGEYVLSLEDILRNLQMNIRDEISYFNIYREDIFNCCIRAMRRKNFDPYNKIDVKFSDIEGVSEGAVDAGGPSREMFRLALKSIKGSRLFVGGNKKFLTFDREALEKREYYEAGRLIALSLVHGGPGPHFFSRCLYMVLIEGLDKGIPCEEYIDYDILEKIEKLKDINVIDHLRDFILEEPIFAIAGCYTVQSLDEREKIIADTMKFYNFYRIKPAYDQFIEGLKTCNIYNLMVENSEIFEEVMCHDELKLTSQQVQNLFEITYSEVGSNKRNVENRVVAFWRDYLLDCEDNSDNSLVDLIIFATGAETIPPLGFPWTPKLLFQHDNDSPYPKANTCGLEIFLPVVHKSYEEFKKFLDFGIENCKDFAFA